MTAFIGTAINGGIGNGGQMLDDLKNIERSGFFIFTEEEAGAMLGAIVAALVVYDIFCRLVAWIG